MYCWITVTFVTSVGTNFTLAITNRSLYYNTIWGKNQYTHVQSNASKRPQILSRYVYKKKKVIFYKLLHYVSNYKPNALFIKSLEPFTIIGTK